jgi:hypothetical protein
MYAPYEIILRIEGHDDSGESRLLERKAQRMASSISSDGFMELYV